MYRNTPIVKQGLNKFGEENLATYIGEYYANRLTGSLKKRVGMFIKQMWLKFKKLVGANMSDADIREYLAGAMFSGTKLGKKAVYENDSWDWQEQDFITMVWYYNHHNSAKSLLFLYLIHYYGMTY